MTAFSGECRWALRARRLRERRCGGYAPWPLLATSLVVPEVTDAQDLGTSRRVQGTAKVTQVEVGDVPGHVVGVVQFKGLTFFADG
jgi:hypothetical protein